MASVFISLSSLAAMLDYDFAGRGSASAVSALLSRVLRDYRAVEQLSAAEASGLSASLQSFDLQIVSACAQPPPPTQGRSKLCFSLSGGGAARVKVEATSAPDLARGLATYLRTTCAYSFSWNATPGHPMRLPSTS